MSLNTPSLQQLLHAASEIAVQAGRLILREYERAEHTVQEKEDRSPLTEADRQAHASIAAALTALTPSYPILSEEAEHAAWSERRSWSLLWLVDPLDGTREFLKRNGEFTVNIALVAEGVPVLGVVYAPALATMYRAVRGGGATLLRGGTEAALRVRRAPPGSLAVVASRSHADPETEALITRLQRRYPDLQRASVGSSLKLCKIAEGAADFYPRLAPTMEWDIAAAQCVLVEAGGQVLDLGASPLRYNKESLRNAPFVALGDRSVEWADALPQAAGDPARSGS